MATPTPPTPPAPPDPAPTESAPVWSGRFALLTAVPAAAALAGLVWLVHGTSLLPDGTADGAGGTRLAATTRLAAELAKPLLYVGLLLVVVGLWMALTEWRGRFAAASAASAASAGVSTAAVDPAALVEALGKLKGAALVMVCGVVLLLGPAWIAASAAGGPEPSGTGTGTGAGTGQQQGTPRGGNGGNGGGAGGGGAGTPSAIPTPEPAPAETSAPAEPSETPSGRG